MQTYIFLHYIFSLTLIKVVAINFLQFNMRGSWLR